MISSTLSGSPKVPHKKALRISVFAGRIILHIVEPSSMELLEIYEIDQMTDIDVEEIIKEWMWVQHYTVDQHYSPESKCLTVLAKEAHG